MTDLLFIHWNVDPVLLHLGPLSIRWYSLLFVSGFIYGWYIMRSFYRKEGVNEAILDPFLYIMLIATILGARLGHCLFYQPEYYFGTWQGFLEVFQPWKGGLASHGGAIGIMLGIWYFTEKYGKKNGIDYLWKVDRLVIIVCFAGACIRLGNFFNSEIYGYNTTLPWGVVFERSGDPSPKHPTMLYEALCYVLLGALLLYLYNHRIDRMKRGQFFGLFFIGCFGSRFLLEFTKAPSRVLFHIGDVVINMGHMLSIPFILAGIIIFVWAAKNGKPAKIVRPEPRAKKVETHYAKPLR